MEIDIIIVTYNSSKWVNACLESIRNSSFSVGNVHLTLVDNKSSDNTVELLERYPKQKNFGSFTIIKSEVNLGFGKANNLAVSRTNQDYIFFLNIDTELDLNCLSQLEKTIQSSCKEVALWECRQFPYEHPKYYNPVNLETTWASGAACVVKRNAFVDVGMFDEEIFMYAEDVDLSWRLRARGYKLLYSPNCIVHHYTYQSAGEVKPNQYYNSTYNNLMMRYKFGTWKDIIKGYILYGALMVIPNSFKGHRKKIAKSLVKSIAQGIHFRQKGRHIRNAGFKPKFKIWNYEIVREGAFYVNELPSSNPLVSVIIRTCGRPDVLREALLTVRHQTYSNIEVVIVEDGPAISEEMIRNDFFDLNIRYISTEKNVGRCIAGNIALTNASGELFNFLDDDDVLFADHIEVLVAQYYQHHSDNVAIYAIGLETPIRIMSKTPYVYEETSYNLIHRQEYDRRILLHHNYFPIQTVLFSRKLFDQFGGFDPKLEVLEDWDLWLRYSFAGEFYFVDKVTSMYRVPSEPTDNLKRQQMLDHYLKVVREKHVGTGEANIEAELSDFVGFKSKLLVVMSQIRQGRYDVLIYKMKNKLKAKIKKIF
ncbi:glycosyltransferase family 2 protein [Cohnella sp. REN36]|uniref:glycosyltransferase family 2 protein n=1 Tax=Cohnella sp. REN36 TaxID=2887347 RepID=UPI001D14D14E|nr:glycosyltransferase family 2 protein [Cohnella sp. REN36]MCC3374101.1 glycosyltransferase family 2 protein [Cohnella sp. REN36]